MAKETTAVEWLLNEINKLTGLTINPDEPIVEQAKQMEKREKRLDIISAFESGKLMEKANSNKTGDEYYFCNYIDNE